LAWFWWVSLFSKTNPLSNNQFPMNRFLLLSLLWCLSRFGANALPSNPFEPFLILTDTIHPVITCPPNDTVQLGPGDCTAVVNYTVTATDNLPGVFVVQAIGLPSGSSFPAGSTLNLFVASDAAGNTATCSFNVYIKALPAVLICKDMIVVKLDANCSAMVTPAQMLEAGTVGCVSAFYIEVDKSAPFGNGPWLPTQMNASDNNKTYQFRVTDPVSGNRCWGNGLIIDSMPPHLECPPIVVPCASPSTLPAFLKDSLGIANALLVATDNCSGTIAPVFVDVPQAVPCTPAANGVRKNILRTWTAIDAIGNKTVCTQNVALKAQFSDVFFPPDVTVTTCDLKSISEAQGGEPYFKVGTHHYPVVLTPSCNFDTNFFDTLEPTAGCAKNRLIRRTWKIYDLCVSQPAANPYVGIQHISVEDVSGPVIHCVPDVTLHVSAPSCAAPVDFPDFIISDNCSKIADLQAFWTDPGGLTKVKQGRLTDFPGNDKMIPDTLGVLDTVPDFAVGVTVVVYSATDACGNTGICQFNLHVWDSIPPTAVCRTGYAVYLGPDGKASLPADSLNTDSYDDCNGVVFRARPDNATMCQKSDYYYNSIHFCCSDAGDTIQVRLRVYDVQAPADSVPLNFGPGHFGACTVPVTVHDTLPPRCSPPPSVTVSCEQFDPMLPYGQPAFKSCQVDSVALMVNYAQFDTVCNRGTILRVFKTFHQGMAGGTCTQQIVVNYKQDYYVRFPDDVIATVCDADNNYGQPVYFGVNCERMHATFTDNVVTVVPDACYKIERNWTVYNGCTYVPANPLVAVPNPSPNPITNNMANFPGPVVSAAGTTGLWAPTVIKVNSNDPAPTDYSTFWSAGANGYSFKQIIKVIDTKPPVVICPSGTVTECDSTNNDAYVWNELYWMDNVTGLHDLCEGPADLSISGTDLCSGANVTISYQLFLDLDGDGTTETVVSSNSLPGWNTVYFNNINNPNYAGGTPRSFDERPVPVNQKYGFALQTTTDGKNKIGALRWNTQQSPNTYVVPQLPYGTHKIKWTVSDGCGNELTCQYPVVVKDCKKPTVVCLNGLGVSLGQGGTIQLFASDFLQYGQDNCTPANQLKYGIRKTGTGTGFPTDGTGNPITSVNYICPDIGTQHIELWAIDKAGNAGYCSSYVIIKDDGMHCNPNLDSLTVLGNIRTGLGGSDGVSGVDVTLSVTPYTLPTLAPEAVQTDTAGAYAFATKVPVYGNYMIVPKKNDDPLNGVTTYDLVLISKHILGQQKLTDPYRIIAADANKSGSVTTLDIVELRKLILGIYTTFPNNDSWRFVDRSFVFPNPTFPFQTPFPEIVSTIYSQAVMYPWDFIAVKTGDVNGSAAPHNGAPDPVDRSVHTVYFDVEDRQVVAGETFTVALKSAQPVLGYQFTLGYEGLELESLMPGAGMTTDHFGVFPRAITTSYNSPEDEGSLTTFGLRFRALRSGRLSDMMGISSNITSAEAYVPGGFVADAGLRFDGNRIVRPGLELYQNVPNPFSHQTQIGFNLPADCRASLKVYTVDGRVVFDHSAEYGQGFHRLTVDLQEAVSGMLYYQLETPEGTLTRKMTSE
jgi:hypothetical protein